MKKIVKGLFIWNLKLYHMHTVSYYHGMCHCGCACMCACWVQWWPLMAGSVLHNMLHNTYHYKGICNATYLYRMCGIFRTLWLSQCYCQAVCLYAIELLSKPLITWSTYLVNVLYYKCQNYISMVPHPGVLRRIE